MMIPRKSPSTFMSCSDEPGLLRRTEPRAILRRIDERPHHLRIDKVAVEVQLGKPERKAAVIRIAQQVTEVFHLHKPSVKQVIENCRAVGGVKYQHPPRRCLRPIYYLEQHIRLGRVRHVSGRQLVY